MSAHVKWFSNFSFADPPRPLTAILKPTVIGFAIFSAIVIGILVPIDLKLAQVGWYQRINQWLESYSDESLLIMRVGTEAEGPGRFYKAPINFHERTPYKCYALIWHLALALPESFLLLSCYSKWLSKNHQDILVVHQTNFDG